MALNILKEAGRWGRRPGRTEGVSYPTEFYPSNVPGVPDFAVQVEIAGAGVNLRVIEYGESEICVLQMPLIVDQTGNILGLRNGIEVIFHPFGDQRYCCGLYYQQGMDNSDLAIVCSYQSAEGMLPFPRVINWRETVERYICGMKKLEGNMVSSLTALDIWENPLVAATEL